MGWKWWAWKGLLIALLVINAVWACSDWAKGDQWAGPAAVALSALTIIYVKDSLAERRRWDEIQRKHGLIA